MIRQARTSASARAERLAPEKWAAYFAAIPVGPGSMATVEVLGTHANERLQLERLPLEAIAYDPRRRVLELSVGCGGINNPIPVRHFIHGPREIFVERPGRDGASTVLIRDESDTHTLIGLYEPPPCAEAPTPEPAYRLSYEDVAEIEPWRAPARHDGALMRPLFGRLRDAHDTRTVRLRALPRLRG